MIAFLTSRLGILACAAAALFLMGLYTWGLQQQNGKLSLEKVAAETRTASLQRDVDAGKAAEQNANKIIRDLSAKSTALDEKVREYAKELESRPDGNCALTDADIDRLRHIGG